MYLPGLLRPLRGVLLLVDNGQLSASGLVRERRRGENVELSGLRCQCEADCGPRPFAKNRVEVSLLRLNIAVNGLRFFGF